MSLFKINAQEHRTILDFSQGEISKSLVRNALQNVEVITFTKGDGFRSIDNEIRIGMYLIRLYFYPSLDTKNRLKEYGEFQISLHEIQGTHALKQINPRLDSRFNQEYWVSLNSNGQLKPKNLIDIIIFVKRLNNLKVFL